MLGAILGTDHHLEIGLPDHLSQQRREVPALLQDLEDLLEPVGIAELRLLEQVPHPIVDHQGLGSLLELLQQVVDVLEHLPFGALRQRADSRGDRFSILSGQLGEDPVPELGQLFLGQRQAQREQLLAEQVPLHQEDQKHGLRFE